MNPTILLVDERPDVVRALEGALELQAYTTIHSTVSCQQALDILQNHEIHILIAGFRFSEMDGLDFVTKALEIRKEVQSILIADPEEMQGAKDALHQDLVVGCSTPRSCGRLYAQITHFG